MNRPSLWIFGLLFLSLVACPGAATMTGGDFPAAPANRSGTFRTLHISTSETTRPDLAVSPDGRIIYFTLLGHLFRVPAGGGKAEQLTWGFAYDSDPAVSPDGSRLAFVSDRDGSGGNVFLLDLAGGKLRRLTRERQAAAPVFSPDGRIILFGRPLLREEYPGVIGFGSADLTEIKTVSIPDGEIGVISPPVPAASLFFLPDGRPGWTASEAGSSGGMFGGPRNMEIVARETGGRMTPLGSIRNLPDEAVPNPTGPGWYGSTGGKICFFPFPEGKPVELATVTDGPSSVAVARDGSSLVYAGGGKLWRIRLPDGKPEPVPFQAAATLEMRRPVEPSWVPPAPGPASPRAVASPVLSPDGRRLVFMAAGFLYGQSVAGEPARRLFAGDAFEFDPAFSPDGRQLAYSTSIHGRRELRVYDFNSRQERILYTAGGASMASLPAWSPDGSSIVVQRSDGLADPFRIIRISLADGGTEEITRLRGAWTARPHFSADARFLYYTARTGKYAALYRLALEANAKPEPLTDTTCHINDGLVSPDGKWLAFRHNTEIRVAPLAPAPLRDQQFRMLTDDCSRSFSFTPGSEAILYAGGRRIWRQPLTGGERQQIPVNLVWNPAQPPPLLIRQIRIFDTESGRFSDPFSMLLQNGSIAWTGPEKNHVPPAGATILEGGGRFVIPGLNDVHVHSAWANHLASEDAFIAFGNTSVRDTGASLGLLNALRDRSETTGLPLPRYWFSGEILEGAMPLWGDAFLQIGTEAEARLAVRKWKEWGADLIKVYLTVPWDLQNVMAEEAQKAGLPVAGHSISHEELVRHVRQGYATVEHTPSVMYEDGRKLLAASGTRWVGTLTCEGGSEIFMREDPPVHMASRLVDRFVPPEKRQAALKGGRLSYYPEEYWPVNMKGAFERNFAAFREGVQVRAGTDALMAEVFFGLSLHWELEFYNMAGLTPPETLRLGTGLAAETVGAREYLGSLAPGQLADLVILDANPLENIQNTIKIHRVVKGGWLFDPLTLRPEPTADPAAGGNPANNLR